MANSLSMNLVEAIAKAHSKEQCDRIVNYGGDPVRLLQFISIPRCLQDLAVERCFALFRNPKEPIAIRVLSMSVLGNIARDQPELKNELKILIEDQLPSGSAAFVSPARKVFETIAVNSRPSWP